MTVIVPLKVTRDHDYNRHMITVAVMIELESVGVIVGKYGGLRLDDW